MNAFFRNTLFAAVLLPAACAAPPSGPVIIAHRGASYDAPENTVASANLAWERGADAVEVDIYLSKDGRIVVIHDSSTKRIFKRDRKVADQTLAELKELDVGGFKGGAYAGEGIPTLDEVLATVPEGKTLVIEIKCGPAVVPVLKRTLDEWGRPKEAATIIAFDWETIKAAKAAMPERTAHWLSGLKRNKEKGVWEPAVDHLVTRALEAGVDGLNVKACEYVDAAFVKAVKTAGLKCLAWTVNDPLEARRLADLGLDAITTDRPRWLKERLREEG